MPYENGQHIDAQGRVLLWQQINDSKSCLYSFQ